MNIDDATSPLLICILALCCLAPAAAFLIVLVTTRWLAALSWRRSLVAYRLYFPRGVIVEDVAAWLGVVAATTRRLPICLELEASDKGIAHYLVAPEPLAPTLLAQLGTALHGVRAEEVLDDPARRYRARLASELRLSDVFHPLAHDRAQHAVAALLAGLHPFARGEVVRLQWIIRGTAARMTSPSDLSETKRALRAKHVAPLLNAVGRVVVSAPTKGRAISLTARVLSAWRVLDAPSVVILRRWLPTFLVARRAANRATPLTVWPLRLNAKEAVGLLGIPVSDPQVPGLKLGAARQLPPGDMAKTGLILARSNFPGTSGRPLALTRQDRLHHVHLLGPTGVGKSTLLAAMALQDIARGDGLVLIDPKGDLVEEVLARLPEARHDDVIVLDPAATDAPIGFNLLQASQDEHGRELVVDHVVRIFAELWRGSWGPRTSDVLRSALLTLTHAAAHDGSTFTLCEVPELLTNAASRRFVTAQASVPASVRSFWYAYESMSDGERAQVVGPALNKLRALTTRTSLRLMLGQSAGIDLGEVFRARRVLLVSLSKGTVGTETAHLLGSLLMTSLWQATLARAAVPARERRPAWAYLDEFQDVLRLGAELTDMLAQARGLGLGLVLAHQYLEQLPRPIRAAVLGTVRSQIVFQCEYDDAKALERRFAPALTAHDLMGLAAHEVAIRPCVAGQTRAPVTGTTMPLAGPLHDPRQLARASRQRYGVPRAEVEAGLRGRVDTGRAVEQRIGRTRKEARS